MSMKKYFFYFVFTLMAISANAAEVSKELALQKAMSFLSERGVDVEDATITPFHNGAFYAVNIKPQGWVVISADDVMTPVLGYSTKGEFAIDGMPQNILSWFNVHSDFVSGIKAKAISIGETSYRHYGWSQNDLSASAKGIKASSSSVPEIIKVNWNQSGSYNAYCPVGSDGKRAVVGCVAVAMAQAMSVCQYPERPVGSCSYAHSTYGTIYINYDKEAPYNWSDIMSGANNKDEVARLLYHCGVSVHMDYGPDGSGTQSAYIASALKNYYSYPSSVGYISRGSVSEDEYCQVLQEEIKNGRAVCYQGIDTKRGYGHCFNLDGWDGDKFYHVNWGWGGANNGYFSIDALKDATMNMDYTDNQGFIYGIRPPSVNPSDIQLSNKTVQENLPAGTVVGDVTVVSEATNPSYTYEIKGPYSPITHRYVTAPFQVVDGKLVTTKPLSCSDVSEWNITMTATNTETKASYTKSFKIIVTSASGIDNVLHKAENLPHGIYDASGRKVAESKTLLPGSAKGLFIEATESGSKKFIMK